MARVWRLGLLAAGILIAGCIAPTGASEMPTPVPAQFRALGYRQCSGGFDIAAFDRVVVDII
jgi:hypothetical protein